MAGETKRSKWRLTALDWSLILAAVLLIGGALWRLGLVSRFVPKAEPEQTEYLVSFRVQNIRSTSGDLFEDGTEFLLKDGTVFGTVSGDVAVTPAELYMENEEGKCILTYYPEAGDDSRIDVSGTFLAKASVSADKGFLLLNGKYYLAPGQSWTLYSGELVVDVLITNVAAR